MVKDKPNAYYEKKQKYNSNNKILYISYDGMTDPLGQSQVLPYLEGLSKEGYQISLISCEKKVPYQANKLAITAWCDRCQIDWYPIFYTKSPPILSTIYDVVRIQKLGFRLHKKVGFSIVHCRSYIAALVGQAMKKKLGIPFIFDMRGFYADERVDGKIWNLNNPIFRQVFNFFKRKEKRFFEQADYSISLTEKGKEEIHSWSLKQQPIPIKVIPCCADLDLFSYQTIEEKQQEQLRQALGITKHDFVLTYLGSIGTWYMLKEMLRFFQRLQLRKPEAKFLFITKDAPTMILKKARKMGIGSERIIIQAVARDNVPLYLSLTDLAIFFIKPVFSKKASSPTKQGEIMGMGIPLICNGIGDTDKIVEAHKVGIVLKNFSENTMEQAINQIHQLQKIPKAQIREGAFRHYDLKKGIQQYQEVYQQVLNTETVLI